MTRFGSRIYLVGSDYVFPRVAHWLIRKQVALLGGEVVGERYLPLGSKVFAEVADEIRQRKPDLVINTINGDSNLPFFHALHEAGIRAEEIPVLSFSLGETELAQFHAGSDGAGHYVAWNYVQSIDSPENREFVAAFRARFGSDRVVTDPMEAAWIGVHLWVQAVRSAQSMDTAIIRQTIAHQSMLAPEGVVSVDHQTHHLWKTVRIARIGKDRQFAVLWRSREPVRPDPFPALTSKREAMGFLQHLYDGWQQHWTAPLSASAAALAATP